MSNEKAGEKVPRLKITDIKLRSVYYRGGKTDLSTYDQSLLGLEGKFRFSFSARKKNSFKMRSTEEIKVEDVFFRVRHEARFVSDVPLTKQLFENVSFQHAAINMMLPFASELFANLTGKTFTGPVIAPPRIPQTQQPRG